jgi:predicted O-linked N-acetylglucosamine transferase (SPINDLY family)
VRIWQWIKGHLRGPDANRARTRARTPTEESTANAFAEPATLAARLESAMAAQQNGSLDAAREIYQSLLKDQPENFQVLHHLGVIKAQLGDLDAAATCLDSEAITHFRRALEIDPGSVAALENLANLFLGHRRFEDAADLYTRAAALEPDNPAPPLGLAAVSTARGDFGTAVAHYESALDRDPSNAAVLNDLGAAYLALDRSESAIESLQSALGFDPRLSAAHRNLAAAFTAKGDPAAALMQLETAARITPDDLELREDLARLLLENGDVDAAIGHLEFVAASQPNALPVQRELAHVLSSLGRWNEAIPHYLAALDHAPEGGEIAGIYNDLAKAYWETARLEIAKGYFLKAIDADPSLALAYVNLGSLHIVQGEAEAANSVIEGGLLLFPADLQLHSLKCICSNLRDGVTHEEQFFIHREFGRCATSLAHAEGSFSGTSNDPNRRLKVGYVSPDFRFHSVACFITPIIEAHDRKTFTVFCYSNVGSLYKTDAQTEYLESISDGWRDISQLDDQAAARQIDEDQIDILVDLAGHYRGNRLTLFAGKPAPVQISYLGYPNTTGLPCMDYRLTDGRADPPGDIDKWYTETLIRLPESFLCFKPMFDFPDISEGIIGEPGVIFGSLNELGKISPRLVGIWARILDRLGDAKLLLKAIALSSEDTRKRMISMCSENGIDPDRLILRGRTSSFEEHLAFYNQIDVALDTFPYHGTTTTCEALYMGVPVVTLVGDDHRSRVGLSLLSAVGEDDLATRTAEEYIERAIALAEDVDKRRKLRRTLRGEMDASPLMDQHGFTRALEAQYRGLWGEWCRDETERRARGSGV